MTIGMKPHISARHWLAFCFSLSAILSALEVPIVPYFQSSIYDRRLEEARAAMSKHYGFDSWKGTVTESGKAIQRLPVSADMFPPVSKKSIVFIEGIKMNCFFGARMEDKKDRLNFAEIKFILCSTPLNAQKKMLSYWSALRANCSMFMDRGVRLDADTALKYKICGNLDTAIRFPVVRKDVKYIDDAFRYMIFDDPFKYMIGDHCIYSKGNYLSFTRNNVMVSISFRKNDEKMFEMARRIDAQLLLASIPYDAETVDTAFVPGFVIDESGFAQKPVTAIKRTKQTWRRFKHSMGDFRDGLAHGMKKLFR